MRRRSRCGGSKGFFPRSDVANLSITRRCRRHCGYCFARHELDRESAAEMPPEIYDAALAFLDRSGFPEARLLGGEPTEHPRFCEYVTRASERGFRVLWAPGIEEIGRLALNFVPLGPYRILMAANCPNTQAMYEEAGIECVTVEIGELGKAAGGMGCLTGILKRE